ncbi:hypothetical protein [Lactiplantibacillus modestisalitolerans]|uniref:Uncharacterized protein n=1 Tax=Lactiplantibacillus modestisalitolerans TaxID=1457219 RepID=A0ABV5WS48_9LACO|nr:hypothetical protein [Lactiplantibacillus modestisalitolerans]
MKENSNKLNDAIEIVADNQGALRVSVDAVNSILGVCGLIVPSLKRASDSDGYFDMTTRELIDSNERKDLTIQNLMYVLQNIQDLGMRTDEKLGQLKQASRQLSIKLAKTADAVKSADGERLVKSPVPAGGYASKIR